ncbi:MAG: dihydropyrimidinase [Chloroflexota bacterium]|nr:dihydropyrimidinase [Chloroflexota bacterium]
MDVIIRNGTLITPSGIFPADVGIVGEHIAALGEVRAWLPCHCGAVELDATGCYVLPGGVDPHVHLQMPAGSYVSADDFASGTVAAACGGTTTVIDFVEPEPGEPLLAALEKRRAEADGRVAVDYGLHMTIPAWHAAHSDYGKPPSSLAEVVAAGVVSFKLYLAYEGLRLDDAQLYRVMRDIAVAGGLPIVHCENGPICETLRAQAVALGNSTPIYHALTRPPRQEVEAVSRAIDVAALAGSPLYVVHVSCEEGMLRIQAARARGEPVYGETCPQYLLLDGMALDLPGGERLVCSPPLRTEEDNEALWGGLVFDDLDVLATDHCPFTAAEKSGHANFTAIPGGLPSIEARLSLAHHFGRQHRMALERWVEVCCTNPARIFGLDHKGQIAPGLDADLVIFDPERWVTIRAGGGGAFLPTLHEQVDWSPYEGMAVQGWPRDVLSRGRVIVRDGEFVGQMGWGRFVQRERR